MICSERVPARIMEQIGAVPVPPIMEEAVQMIQVVPQEQQERVVAENIDVPMTLFPMKEFRSASRKKSFPFRRQWRCVEVMELIPQVLFPVQMNVTTQVQVGQRGQQRAAVTQQTIHKAGSAREREKGETGREERKEERGGEAKEVQAGKSGKIDEEGGQQVKKEVVEHVMEWFALKRKTKQGRNERSRKRKMASWDFRGGRVQDVSDGRVTERQSR